MDDYIFPAAPAHLVRVIPKRLADAFDVIEQTYLTAHELGNPDRHRIRAVPRSADVEERLHRQNRIDGNMTDPFLLPCQLKRLGEVGALKSPGVVALTIPLLVLSPTPRSRGRIAAAIARSGKSVYSR